MPLINFTWKKLKIMRPRTEEHFEFNYVSRIFLSKQLKKLKTINTTVLDNFPPALLKDCANVIAGPLSHLINLSLKTGTVPQIWKRARITPLHKSGSTPTPENYRPISILHSLPMVLEKAFHQQLYGFLDEPILVSNC